MNELKEEDFADLCRDSRVGAQIAGVEGDRAAAARIFWITFGAALFAAAATVAISIMVGWPVVGIILALVIAVFGLVYGRLPLSRVANAIREPVLGELAAKAGATYTKLGFDPPLYADAGPALFGRVTEKVFADLFQATDASGRRNAFYQARLYRGAGKSKVRLFGGQVYVFRRARRGIGDILILPKARFFDSIDAPNGIPRVAFGSEPDFEAAFQVYARRLGDAQSFLGQAIRRTLIDLRRVGEVSVYVGADDIFVAVIGKPRFVPGSLFSKMPGRDRVRIMFDDVRTAVASLNRLVAELG